MAAGSQPVSVLTRLVIKTCNIRLQPPAAKHNACKLLALLAPDVTGDTYCVCLHSVEALLANNLLLSLDKIYCYKKAKFNGFVLMVVAATTSTGRSCHGTKKAK